MICFNAAMSMVNKAKKDAGLENKPTKINMAHIDSEKAAINPKSGFAKSNNPPKYFVKASPRFSHLEGLVILLQP